MKITKSQLKQIIKEELTQVLNEDGDIATMLSGMSDDEAIAFMSAVESDEDMQRAGRTQRYMKYPHAEKAAWFEREGWQRLNARIWTAHGGHGGPPMHVDEEDFQKALQLEFDEIRPQSFEEATEIFNQVYYSMEDDVAGWDT